jgi:hypothetical protein
MSFTTQRLSPPGIFPTVLRNPLVLVSLLFDTLHSRLTSQAYALDRIRKFLHQIEPQDRLGIYVLGQDLEVAHDLTRDATDLVAAIQRYDELHSHALNKNPPKLRKGRAFLNTFLLAATSASALSSMTSRVE